MRIPLHVGGGAGHEVTRPLVVVEGETEALELLVVGVADVVRDSLAQRLAEVLLAVGGHAAADAEDQNNQCKQEQLAKLAGLQHRIHSLAEDPRDGQRERGHADCGRVGQEEPELVLQSKAK